MMVYNFRITCLLLIALSIYGICRVVAADNQLDYNYDEQEYQQLKQQLMQSHRMGEHIIDGETTYIYLFTDDGKSIGYHIGSQPQPMCEQSACDRYQFTDQRSGEVVRLQGVDFITSAHPFDIDARLLSIQKDWISTHDSN